MKIKTLIVDDEPLARNRIRKLLEDEADIEVAGECENGVEAVEAIEKIRPDLLFLDVQMPGHDGFKVVELIGPDEMPVTIFVTAFDAFALRAFDAHALDYLLKPFDVERLRQAVSRAREHISLRRRGDLEKSLAALLADLDPSSVRPERFLVRVGARINFVDVDQVDWIAAEGNYLRLHVGNHSHLVRETLASADARLSRKKFLRIHRSTIVNLSRIKAVESLFQGEYVVILNDGTKLKSSSSYRERLESALMIAEG